MGVWFRKVKVSIPATEVVKIPAQREKLMKVLTPSPSEKVTFQERQEKNNSDKQRWIL